VAKERTKKEKGKVVATEAADLQAEAVPTGERKAKTLRQLTKEQNEKADGLLDQVGTGTIVYVPISRLTLLETNPRLIGRAELTKLANSIEADKAFFEARPCLVNKVGTEEDFKLVVYAGNMRVRAVIMLGWRMVPCIIDEITEQNQDTRMFKDNMHAGEFDMAMLMKTFDVGYLLQDVGMNLSKKDISKHLKEDAEKADTGADADLSFGEDDFEDGDDLRITEGPMTNVTNHAALDFKRWQLPLSKEDDAVLDGLVEEWKKKNKDNIIGFWNWMIAQIIEHERTQEKKD